MTAVQLLRLGAVDGMVNALIDTVSMTKRYVAFLPGGKGRVAAIAQGFVFGLADFGCFGTKMYDLAGYPYEDEAEALFSDWETVGADLWKAIEDGPEERGSGDREQSSSGSRVRRQSET